jgi:multidrug efflux pump subunit AcrA (membrane-fusion protein)
MIRLLTLIAAILGVVAYLAFSFRMEKSMEDSAVVPSPPPSSPFKATVGAGGLVEALGENVNVASIVSGVVEKVFVAVGDTVKKGDPLFQVVSSQESTALASSKKELAVLEAAVEVAAKELEQRQDIYDRTEKLLIKNVSSAEEGVQAVLVLGQVTAQLAKAQADLELGKARVIEAEAALDRTLVKAPRDGEILRINVREGEYAQPFLGDGALVLGDTKRLQVRVDIDEYNAQLVRSAAAVAYPKGDRTKSIPLSFSRFEPLVVPKESLTGAPVERVDTRVLQVIYSFECPDWPIYVGQQLDVFIDAGDSGPSPSPAGK